MDGARLAFVALHPNGRNYRLATMPAAGGVAVDLLPSGTFPARPRRLPLILDLAWMPGGDRLAVAGPEHGFASVDAVPAPVEWLWEVPLSGAPPRKIGPLRLPKVEGLYRGVNSFSVPPDGKQLAFQRHEGVVSQTWALDNLLQFVKAGRTN